VIGELPIIAMTWMSIVPAEWAGATTLMADELSTWYELAIVDPNSTPMILVKPLPTMLTVVPPLVVAWFGETPVMAALSSSRDSQTSAARLMGPKLSDLQ
jgi:hypothetical protein